MPRLRIKALKLLANTPEGSFGNQLAFSDGLFVLWADNTMGKSTTLQAIIYALGLEGMFGPSQDVPLPHAMTDHLEVDSRQLPVLSSEVLLEVDNGVRSITVRRPVVGGPSNNLVTVWDGPLITESTQSAPQRDFYVRSAGAARSEMGFHAFLAEFIGWTLPQVPRHPTGETRLYMEVLFPLFFVEQKKGWSQIPARFPTYLQIREISRRAIEFVLALDSYDIDLQRQRLKDQERDIKVRWAEARLACDSMARSVGGVIEGVPREPPVSWPPLSVPRLIVPKEGAWIPLGDATRAAVLELQALLSAPIPTTGDNAAVATEELLRTEQQVLELETAAEQTSSTLEVERGEALSLSKRASEMELETRRLSDLRKLRALGSALDLKILKHSCPTCDQAIDDSLLSQAVSQNVMSVDDNLELLGEERTLVEAMVVDSERRQAALLRALTSLRNELEDRRARLRVLKDSLESAASRPSADVIQRRIRLESAIELQRRVSEEWEVQYQRFEPLFVEWTAVQAQKSGLARYALSVRDEEKLSFFEAQLRESASRFGFLSLSLDKLSIDRETFRPVYGGFELDFDVSASDQVRIIWSYLLALMQTSARFGGNHPGLLIMDEPRQQSARHESFRELFRAAGEAAAGSQIIVATSENRQVLKHLLEKVPHVLEEIPGRVLTRV